MTELGKIVEFCQILLDNGLSKAKNSFSDLCRQSTCIALALHQKGKTHKATSLCTSVIQMFNQCINNINDTAKKYGLFILEPEDLQLNALQLQRIVGQKILQNNSSNIAEAAETIIESFEYQLGFFGSVEERDQYLKVSYDTAKQIIQKLQIFSPILTAPNSTASKQVDTALLFYLGIILQSVTQSNSSYATPSEPRNSPTKPNIANTEKQIPGKEVKRILRELLSGILEQDHIEEIKPPQTISAE